MKESEGRKPQRLRDPDTNPCLKEADLSVRCLEQNHYDNKKCSAFFDNYNLCKVFWHNIMLQRKMSGINPAMPGEKERKKIKAEVDKGHDVIFVNLDD